MRSKKPISKAIFTLTAVLMLASCGEVEDNTNATVADIPATSAVSTASESIAEESASVSVNDTEAETEKVPVSERKLGICYNLSRRWAI